MVFIVCLKLCLSGGRLLLERYTRLKKKRIKRNISYDKPYYTGVGI